MRYVAQVLFFLALGLFSSAFAVQKTVRVATSDSVQTDVDTTWFSSIYNVDTSKPVTLIVYISQITGNCTIRIDGLAVIPGDTWPTGSTESIVNCVQRASINSGGRYYLQATPSVIVNSSTVGGILPFVRVAVQTDNAATTIFSAYLTYHIPDQVFGAPE